MPVKQGYTTTDNSSKELIFHVALSFFRNPFKNIDQKSFKQAKEILKEIEEWEMKHGKKEFSTIKNNAILVSYLAYKFGESVGIDKKKLSNIYIAGLVQSIGKIYMCNNDKELAYEYISSPLKKGEVGFEEIANALKRYPLETQKYLEEKTKFNKDIIDTAVSYHSVYSNLFEGGYPSIEKEVSMLDTVLWFADSLSAISFNSIPVLQRNYSKGKYVSLIEGFELLREQTGEKIPAFWSMTSGSAIMGVVLAMAIGSASPSKANASNYSPDEVISLVNEYRTKQGLSTLTADDKLMQAAVEKANDMLEKDYWDHYGPDGETPWQFIEEEGYKYTLAGENLAKGFDDVQEMMQAWLDSPTHLANIVKPGYENIGVAVIDGNLQGKDVTLVVQVFAKEESQEQTQQTDILQSFKSFLEKIADFLKG